MTEQTQDGLSESSENPGHLAGASGASLAGPAPGDTTDGAGKKKPAAPGPEKKRRASRFALVSGFLTFLLAAAALVGIGAVFADRALRAPGPLSADKVVYIPQGTDSDQIVEQLTGQGVIDQPLLFSLGLAVEGARSKLKAGEYLFKQSASVQDVIDAMASGKVLLHSLTIPEGLTSFQAVERLRQDDLLVGDIRDVPREGAILPETYKYQRGDSRDKLLQKMIRDQKKLLDEIWAGRAPESPLVSPYELVTLASIVEKETGKAEERPHVAAVFLNRLKKHMRLQSDPTIVYGLVGGQGSLGRPLTQADIASQTVYNTYVIDGLPPGPIANPGRAALEAAANPLRSNDLYFVADGTGGHVFAETLDAHNRNVQRWRQIEQNRKPGTPAPADGRENHGEILAPGSFGAAPDAARFAARKAPPPAPKLKSDPALMARVSPLLPGAPPAPQNLAEYRVAARDGAAGLAFADLGDVALGGVTRAENELDGPADAVAGAPIGGAAAAPGRKMAASDLDGPAAPIESPAGALGYAGPVVNAAPNGKPRIFDAAEGTALDPLLDKSWDLNSAKTVDAPEPKPAGKTGKTSN